MKKVSRSGLVVYTDELYEVYGAFNETLSDIKFCDSVDFYTFDELDESKMNDPQILYVGIINNIDSVAHSVINKVVALNKKGILAEVYTANDKSSIYEDVCNSFTVEGETKCNIFTTFVDFKEAVSKNFKQRTRDIAFVSDNDDFMNNLFDNLKKTILDDYHKNGDTSRDNRVNYVEPDIKRCLRNYMPELILGWVYQYWYKKKYDLTEIEEMPTASDYEAYVTRLISCQYSDNEVINYYWIKPSEVLQFVECRGFFDKIFIDLCSHYGSVNLNVEHPSKDDRIGWFASTMPDNPKLSGTEVYSNVLTIAGNYMKVVCLDVNQQIDDGWLDYKFGVASIGYTQTIQFPNITSITRIDPFEKYNI
jgi:hypothetical protein